MAEETKGEGWMTWAKKKAMNWLVYSWWPKNAKLIILGLDNSGKSSLSYLLEHGALRTLEPTSKPTSAQFKIQGMKVTIHDMGGHAAARRLWKQYLNSEIQGIVFVMDAGNPAHHHSDSDPYRWIEAKQELSKILADDDLTKIPVLILLNKMDRYGQDADTRQSQAEGFLGLQPTDTRVKLFPCSVVHRQGYQDGFKWLSTKI